MKVTLDAKLPRNLKYNRATDIFIQWKYPDTSQVYGLGFRTRDAADGFQKWLDYAINPPPTVATPTRNASVAAVRASVSPSPSEESHYQRPQLQTVNIWFFDYTAFDTKLPIVNKKRSYRRDCAGRRSLRCSRSLILLPIKSPYKRLYITLWQGSATVY